MAEIRSRANMLGAINSYKEFREAQTILGGYYPPYRRAIVDGAMPDLPKSEVDKVGRLPAEGLQTVTRAQPMVGVRDRRVKGGHKDDCCDCASSVAGRTGLRIKRSGLGLDHGARLLRDHLLSRDPHAERAVEVPAAAASKRHLERWLGWSA